LLFVGSLLFDLVLNIEPERVRSAKVVFAALILSSMFTVMSVPYDAVLNARENMLYFSIVGVIDSLIKLAIAFVIVNYEGDRLELYGMLMVGAPLVILSIMRIYCHKNYAECVFAPFKYWNTSLVKEMTSFAGWNFLAVSANMIFSYGQGIVLNKFFGTTINAAQGIANQINGQLNTLTVNMMKALNPIIAKREGAGNRSGMIQATILGCKLSSMIMIIVFVPVWIEIPYILSIWLTEVPPITEVFCRLVLINTIIAYSFLPIVNSLNAHGDIKWYKIITSAMFFVPLIGMCILFYRGYPPQYAYITHIAYTVFSLCITLYFAYRNFQFTVNRFITKVVLRCTILLIIVSLISALPYNHMEEGFTRLLSVILTSSLSYLIAGWFIGFDSEDRVMFSSIVGKIYTKIIKKKTEH
jgi:O-antigen/teichoic acid export membrane protein